MRSVYLKEGEKTKCSLKILQAKPLNMQVMMELHIPMLFKL